jgi:hypothetical protein
VNQIRIPATLVALAAATTAVAPATAHAQAVARRAQQTYQCVASNGSQTRTEPIGLAFTLSLPPSVAPGETLSLRGSVDLRVSDSYNEGVTSSLFAVRQIEAVSNTLNASITVGDRSFLHPADRWSTGRQEARVPIVPTGPLTFPTLRIPEDARGAVTVRLPGNGFTRNSVGRSPATVAFTAAATAHGVASYTFTYACFLPAGEPNVVGTVPIVVPGTATPPAAPSSGGGGRAPTTTRPASGSGGGRERGTTTTTADGTSASAAEDPFGGGGGTTDGTTADARGDGAATAGGGTAASGGAAGGSGATPAAIAAVPAAREDADGIRLPATWLWIIGVTGVLLLIAWGATARYRLRLLLDREDR